jgi:hypothetical protein
MKTKYIFLLLNFIIVLQQNCFCQLPLPPGIQWKRADWFPEHPVNGPQTQDVSGEDWWYSHINSVDHNNSNTPNGYLCAGYTSFVNYDYVESNDGCADIQNDENNIWDCNELEYQGYVKGADFAVLALISPNGREKVWTRYYNHGDFQRVIQTSDGGYLAIGSTRSTRDANSDPIYYNPGQANTPTAFNSSDVTTCIDCIMNVQHIILVKTNSIGEVEWQYLYGMYPMCDNSGDYDASEATNAYQNEGLGFDVVETDDSPHHYRLVGVCDGDANFPTPAHTSTNNMQNAVMIDVLDDGTFNWGEFYNSTGNGATDAELSRALRIKKYILSSTTSYIISGYYTDFTSVSQGFCMKFDESSSPTPLWIANVGQANTVACSDVEVSSQLCASGDNIILLPVIDGCSNCFSSGDNYGNGFIYEIDGKDGTSLGPPIDVSENGSSQLHAFDLRFGICNTADGGFAVVSSKQPNTPPSPYTCPSQDDNGPYTTTIITGYWNTDAYVAKFNSAFTMEWEKTFDEDEDAPEAFPGDLKKQECLYAITEDADGRLIISGNYSANFDDCYLVKLYDNCNNNISYDIDGDVIDPSTDPLISLTYPDFPNGTTYIRGSIHVADNQTLVISSGSELRFADSRRCGIKSNIIVEPGGHLIINGNSKLTSVSELCPGSMWDGIEVWGNPLAGQSASDQGSLEIYEGSTIENAHIGIMADVAGYNDNGVRNPTETAGGGIITADGANFTNCRRSIHFAPYINGNGQNLSFIQNSTFSCTAAMEDPDYIDNSNRRLGVNAFITINHSRLLIRDNVFTNDDPGIFDLDIRGFGIISHQAGGHFEGNRFNNLYQGIQAQYFADPFDPVSITDDNIFDNNYIGAYVGGGRYHQITGNTFANVPGSGTGVLLYGASGFRVSDNDMTTTEEQLSFNYGVVVCITEKNGGTVGHDNNFDGFFTGTRTEGHNDFLKIRCNNYTNYYMAWDISPQGLPQSTPGSLGNQGTGTAPNDFRAGDTFDNLSNGAIEIESDPSFDFYGWGYPSYTVPVTVNGSVSVHNCAGTSPDAFGGCSIERELYELDELGEEWTIEENEIEKIEIFNLMMAKTIAIDSSENDSLTIALLLEALENGMDSTFIIRQLVESFYNNNNPDSASIWLALLNNDENEDYIALFEALIDYKNENISLYEMQEAIRAISFQNSQEGIAAKTILNYYEGQNYDYYPDQHVPEAPRLSTSQKFIDHDKLEVYPNPASESVSIRYSGELPDTALKIKFTDVMGNEIYLPVERVDGNIYIFQTRNLKNGIYFVQCNGNKQQQASIAKFAILK